MPCAPACLATRRARHRTEFLGADRASVSASYGGLNHLGWVCSLQAGCQERMGELLAFLMEDCCAGKPEICAPLAAIAERAACCV